MLLRLRTVGGGPVKVLLALLSEASLLMVAAAACWPLLEAWDCGLTSPACTFRGIHTTE